jgi:hypothetical protein
MTRRRSIFWPVAFLLLIGALRVAAEPPSSGWIERIEIASLVPFEVTFRFSNRGISRLGGV